MAAASINPPVNPTPAPVPAGTKYYTYKADANKALGGGTLAFQTGKGYFVKPGAAPAPSRAPAATPQPSLEQQAQTATSEQIDPQVKAIQDQIALADQQAAAREQAIQGFTSAAANLVAGLGPQIQDVYNKGAGEMSGIGQGYTDQVASQEQAQQDASRSFINELAPGGDYNPQSISGAKDAEYALGFGIPATEQTQFGVAGGIWGLAQPGITEAVGMQNLMQEISAGKQVDAQFAQQIQQVEATRPAVYQQILSTMSDQQMKQLALQNTLQKTQFDENLSIAKLKLQVKSEQAKLKQQAFSNDMSVARYKLSAQKFAQQTFQQDRQYGLALANLGIRTKSLQLRAAAQEYKLHNNGFTPSQMNKLITSAQFVAQNVKDWKVDGLTAMPTYGKALEQMLKRNVPLSMAQKVLAPLYPNQNVPMPKFLGSIGPTVAGAVGGTLKDQEAVQYATQALGIPYVWGGESLKGFDCSGLLQYAWGRAGVQIPRTTYAQWTAGKAVDPNNLQPGDAVFFKGSDSKMVGGVLLPGHVGIYIGNGQYIVAPHKGAHVQISYLTNASDFMGARRYGG